MKIRLIQTVDGQMICSDFGSVADGVAGIELRGFKVRTAHHNPRTRPELQGAPVFSGLCGPMWDGDAIRYEDPEANDRLSI